VTISIMTLIKSIKCHNAEFCMMGVAFSFFMLNVIMQDVIILNVMAPMRSTCDDM
jgi:hypothetical protein